ncbi:hypothetical protein PV327_006601 [Microctonus hyperodae]|uniref:MMS19 nucleotide excision repair protein n=1 Tax=Microctonus hyperodae TaxID=165561 RepID=A0AA39F4R4_MICHY|nr:hypothetical protein PV327_006601 [Microctonus hyperodae]
MAPTKNFDLVERFSVAFDDDNKLNALCKDIAIDIEKGTIKLFKVVEELGEFLTNTDASIRENGVRSLSIILLNVSKNFLNEQELQLMTLFYCDRLNDHHSIIPAIITGILAIVQMENFPKDSPSKLFLALFRNVRCQSELQETRRNIYTILQILLSSRLEDLKLLGPDFVYGVISSMDGESDPRNLMVLFSFLPHFMKEFNLHHLVEEMFEVIACYFPVDFNSNTKDGREITRDDLAISLEYCLSAIPEFAEYCLPLIIEKLDSNLKIAKMDSLRLLVRSSGVFGVEGLKQHLDELWPLIRREVLPGNDEELKEQALKSIISVTKAVSEDEQILAMFVKKITADTRSSLCDVQLSLYWPAEKLLEAVCKANDKSCRLVLKTVVTLCLAQYTTNISRLDRISLIETLNNFMAIYTEFGCNISDISELSWTDLPLLYLNELSAIKNEYALKAKLIDGLAIQKLSLTECQRQSLYNEVCNEIDCGNNSTRLSCQSIFITFAKLYSNEVLDVINKQLTLSGVETLILKNRIEAFATIGKISNLGTTVLSILVELAICSVPEIVFASLNSIKKLLMSRKFEYNIHNYLYNNTNIMDEIFHLNFAHNYNATEFPELHNLLSDICLLIIRKLSAEDQQNVVEKYSNYLRADMNKNILLWVGLLTPLLPCNFTQQIIDLLMLFVEISLNSTCENTRLSSCRLAAVIINKMNENDNFEKCLNMVRTEIIRILNDDKNNLEQKQAAVILHAWITKALITRGSKMSQNFLDYHVDLLRMELIGEFTGEKFHIFVDKNENTLIEDNFCIVKLFYKQRVFQNIIKQNETFIDNARQNYLIALIHLVEETPMELLLMHLVQLVPLLIESLSLDNGQLILSTLKTLKLLLETKNEIFIEQIQSFISRCLKLSTHPKMHVRIAALNCLSSYCNYSTVSLKPYKDDVLEKLSETIDDKKRLVRQMAVTARIRWYLIGAPGV